MVRVLQFQKLFLLAWIITQTIEKTKEFSVEADLVLGTSTGTRN